ncbi:MAG: SpoIIE family protein phosphatase [Chloroflexi bacterium]|nr:SpoIIE family protein phosphatase [Chloroflexota bacterium]
MLTRNNPAPIFICRGEEIDEHAEESTPLGTSRNVRPLITELGIETGLTVVVFSDGITHAGERRGEPLDVRQTIRSIMEDQDPSPQEIADFLLLQAIRLDDNRPADDISVVVLKVAARQGDDVRRMTVRLPINA